MNAGTIFLIGFVTVIGGCVVLFFYYRNQSFLELAIKRFPTMIKENNIEGVNYLLKYPIVRKHLNDFYFSREEQTFNFLQLAVRYEQVEIFEALLNSGAAVHVMKNDASPLKTAICCKRQDMMNSLLETAINPELSDYLASLVVACVNAENRDVLDLLLQEGANINALKYGQSALHVAIASRKHDMIKYLIEKGAKTDLPDFTVSPLIAATKQNDREAVSLLLHAGANVNALSATQHTSLYYATLNGNEEIEQLLVNSGADLSFKTSRLLNFDDYCSQKFLIVNSEDNEADKQRKLEQLREEAFDQGILLRGGQPLQRDPLHCVICGTTIGWIDKYGVQNVDVTLCNEKMDEDFDLIYTCPGCGKFVASSNLM
jgi:ankyrin repeat protein